MSSILVKAEEHNWGLSGPGSWEKTVWEIHDDGLFFLSMLFRSFDEPQPERPVCGIVDPAVFAELRKAIGDPWSDETVSACDGTAWEFRAYGPDGSVMKHRPLDYIYGIEPFEKMARILSGLVKPIDDDLDFLLSEL